MLEVPWVEEIQLLQAGKKLLSKLGPSAREASQVFQAGLDGWKEGSFLHISAVEPGSSGGHQPGRACTLERAGGPTKKLPLVNRRLCSSARSFSCTAPHTHRLALCCMIWPTSQGWGVQAQIWAWRFHSSRSELWGTGRPSSSSSFDMALSTCVSEPPFAFPSGRASLPSRGSCSSPAGVLDHRGVRWLSSKWQLRFSSSLSFPDWFPPRRGPGLERSVYL